MRHYNPSTNILDHSGNNAYIVTPNAQQVSTAILNGVRTGIHCFSIIGSYGTGKSSFLLAFEDDLVEQKHSGQLIPDSTLLSPKQQFEIINMIGDYQSITNLLADKFNSENTQEGVIKSIRDYNKKLIKKDTTLVIAIDEFGKLLEYAAKHNPESEIYFFQKLGEVINAPKSRIILLTTLHQNFLSYASNLNELQRNEWKKIKGRFLDIAFAEPIEQLLLLASKQINDTVKPPSNRSNINSILKLAQTSGFVSDSFAKEMAANLYPLDAFSAYVIASSTQRYGQNERSLFLFLCSHGEDSIYSFQPKDNLTYNLSVVYDYIQNNFYSYLKDTNIDSMSWASINTSIGRVEGQQWEQESEMNDAIKIVKAIGLIGIFGNARFKLKIDEFCDYVERAMNIQNSKNIVEKLIRYKIVRFAEYKQRPILFAGTDINIEDEMFRATSIIPRPTSCIDEFRRCFYLKVAAVKAAYYQKGTPRYFEYLVTDHPVTLTPVGDNDGFIEILLPQSDYDARSLIQYSAKVKEPIIFALFKNTDAFIDRIYRIAQLDYILTSVLADGSDRVAINEVRNMKEYGISLLDKAINDRLFYGDDNIVWIYKGSVQKIANPKDFNHLLSVVIDDVYHKTPVLRNELFNRHKISGTISAAKTKYLEALVNHSNEPEFGFSADNFPPEKTIYSTLLEDTGLHVNGTFTEQPKEGIKPLWDASVEFLKSTRKRPRKISELISILSTQPYKIKQGVLDFWIPTFLFIKRQDYSLYDADRGAFIPEVSLNFFDLLQRQPQKYEIKAIEVDGVKLAIFNQYRKFINLDNRENITSDKFMETIRPFFFFYRKLNDYTKQTKKFDHTSTLKFRDVLAKAKDPEKTFFEDLPEALGYKKNDLKNDDYVSNYCTSIERAIRELRLCYPHLIDRIEDLLVEKLGLESPEYKDYIEEIRNRLQFVNPALLTDKQREFFNHATTVFDNKTDWYQSICYTILNHPLSQMRDEEEIMLGENLVHMFKACERYADIEKVLEEGHPDDQVFSLDLVSNHGLNVLNKTFRLGSKEKQRVEKLEVKIDKILSGNDDTDICALLSILQKKINQ